MSFSITALNQLDQMTFINLLGTIFEKTPAVAEQVWSERPFENVEELHKKMVAIVERMSLSQQLDLINAHPELGSKKPMADASVQEQASVGLNQIGLSERQQIDSLNGQYREKFGFPFVMAVKGQTLEQVMVEFSNRLQNSKDTEIKRAISEISKIAHFRLEELVSS